MRDETMPGTAEAQVRGAPDVIVLQPLRPSVADAPTVDLPPGQPYDPDEAAALATEPTLYEEDEPGPHFIEVRIGEDEPETEGLPARETTRP